MSHLLKELINILSTIWKFKILLFKYLVRTSTCVIISKNIDFLIFPENSKRWSVLWILRNCYVCLTLIFFPFLFVTERSDGSKIEREREGKRTNGEREIDNPLTEGSNANFIWDLLSKVKPDWSARTNSYLI